LEWYELLALILFFAGIFVVLGYGVGSLGDRDVFKYIGYLFLGVFLMALGSLIEKYGSKI
jgi:drug/metabolite transporter (DMT)-like permease